MVLGVEQNMVTKQPENRSPGMIFFDLRSMVQAGAVSNGLGANVGRKMVQTRPKHKNVFEFPSISPSQMGGLRVSVALGVFC